MKNMRRFWKAQPSAAHRQSPLGTAERFRDAFPMLQLPDETAREGGDEIAGHTSTQWTTAL